MMRTKMTLGVSRSKTNTTTETKAIKPEFSKEDKDAYYWLGQVMVELYRLKFRIKWDKPLAKNFYKKVRKVLSKDFISSKNLNAAIKHHVKSPKYLLMLRPGVFRHDLKGKPTVAVTEFESKHALTELYEHHGAFMRDRRKRRNKQPITSTRKNHVTKHRQTQ
jgi:sRNA-binding protein